MSGRSQVRRLALLTIAALVMLLNGCGDDGADEPVRPSSASPTNDARLGTEWTEVPKRATEQPTEAEMATTSTPVSGLSSPADTNTNAYDADGDGFMSISEFRQAVTATVETYRWPLDYPVTGSFMLEYISRNFPDGSRFQVGYEHTILGSWHRCSWEMTWLDARVAGDQQVEAEALEVLATDVLNNPSFAAMRTNLDDMYTAAALGNPELIVRDIDLNCQMLVTDSL